MLERLAHAPKVVGLKQSRKAVESGSAAVVFVAGDAEARLRARFLALCRQSGVEVCTVPTMQGLGKACGIEVPCAFAAILR